MKKIFKLVVVIVCIFHSTITFAQEEDVNKLSPSFLPVELKELTKLELKIMPHAGTQLVFPFELDNPELVPELKIQLSNPNGFQVPHKAEDIERLLIGQNTITILGKFNNPDKSTGEYPILLGNLFITIGGYNLSITLKTTYDVRDHISNVVFNISDEERNHMIESAVRRRTSELEKIHKERMGNIDHIAKEQSLSHIAIMATHRPKYTAFKSDGKVQLDSARVVVFIDKVVAYNDEYYILLFELDNKSNSDITINQLDVMNLKDKDFEKRISGNFNCSSRLDADTSIKCSFATQDKAIKKAKRLKLQIKTDRGLGEYSW